MRVSKGSRRWPSAAALTAAVLLVLPVGPASAGFIMSNSPKSDCYIEFDVEGASGANHIPPCTDGDPMCDVDGMCGNGCTFRIRLCVNQTNISACTPKAFKAPPKVTKGLVTPPSATGTDAACGNFSNVLVKLKHGGKKPGRMKVIGKVNVTGNPKNDKDILFLTCNPRPSGSTCPPPTSSTTTTTTTPGATTTTTTVPGGCAASS